jgi:hypothetical protein
MGQGESTINAFCDFDGTNVTDFAIGGGFSMSGTTGVNVWTSKMTAANAWRVVVRNSSTTDSINGEAQVICVDIPPLRGG